MKYIILCIISIISMAHGADFPLLYNFTDGTVKMGDAKNIIRLVAEDHPPASLEGTKNSTFRQDSGHTGYLVTGSGVVIQAISCHAGAATSIAIGYGDDDVSYSGANPTNAHWGGGVATGDLARQYYLAAANTQYSFPVGLYVPSNHYISMYTVTDAQAVWCTMWVKQL